MQEGTPAEIYERPTDLFVASFLGAANVLAGKIEALIGEGSARIALDGCGHRLTLGADEPPGVVVDVVLRPENLTITSQDAHGAQHRPGSDHRIGVPGQ